MTRTITIPHDRLAVPGSGVVGGTSWLVVCVSSRGSSGDGEHGGASGQLIPILDGALNTVQKGIVSSLYPENLRFSHYVSNVDRVSCSPNYPLLFDPQTSGGLLAGIPSEQTAACLASLKALGYPHTCVIGRVISQLEGPPITLIK